MAVAPRLRSCFDDYARFHRAPRNLACHEVGIPLIVFSLLGLLSGIRLGPADAAWLLWLSASAWSWRLDWRVGVPYSVLAAGLALTARLLPAPALWLLFLLGWMLQFLGHGLFERRAPAFFTGLRHLLVGPLWIFARRAGYLAA